MAEYYPLLAKAVANLKDSTPETRRAIYERASKALLAQLQKSDPPVPQADIDREQAALAAAADRVEAEIRAKASTPPPPAKTSAPPPAPRPAAPAAPPAFKPAPTVAKPVQLAPGGVAPLPPPPLVRPPSPRPPAPRAPGAGASWPPGPAAQGDAPPVRPAAPLDRRSEPPKYEAPVLSPEEPPSPEYGAPEPAISSDVGDKPRSTAGFFRSFGRSRTDGDASLAEDDRIEAPEPFARDQKPDVARPAAPVPPRTRTFTKRTGVFAILLLLIIAGIGALAYKLRETPEDFARVTPVPEVNEAPAGKIGGRAGERITVSPTPTPAPTQAPAQTVPPPTPSQPSPTVPVAQRAALLVDAPDEPSKVKTYVGTVVWTMGQVSSGLPSLQAKVEIPEAKLTVAIVMTKNTDEALSASNRITVRFTPSPDGPVTGVKQIAAPEMRGEDRPQGDPLGALPAQVTENYFWIALAKDDSIAKRNIDLLRDRGWFDIPILLANDKIAKITVEKGTSGDQLLKQALAAWGQ